MVGLYMFLHCINLDYPNLTCQLRPWGTVLEKNIKQLNRVSIWVILGLGLVLGLGIVLWLILGLMPSSDLVL